MPDELSPQTGPALSVVVPLFNEQESVGPLVRAVGEALADAPAWELVLVDDGSRDDTAAIAEALAREDPRVRVVRLARNYGQTAAMQAGFDHARGAVVVSMDGDLQNDPRDIERLVAALDEGYDLVAGYRQKRQDKVLTRKIPSWLANRIIRRVTGVPIRDNGCSLKAYRREVLQRMRLYSDQHRFIPAVAAAMAGARIAELPVRHHARRYGASKYGLSRVPKVLADLLSIYVLRSFRERPLLLFGALGLLSLLVCLGIVGLVGYLRLTSGSPGSLVTAAGSALCWLGLSCYLLMLGLIAEQALQAELARGPSGTPIVREVRL